jgi:putative Holliday junction resolvase
VEPARAELRILALDLGRKRIGLALYYPAAGTVVGLDTLQRKSRAEDLARLTRVARERKASLIVLGLPLHAGGEESPMSALARQFGAQLSKATGLEIAFQDERLTSVEAESRLEQRGLGLAEMLTAKKRGEVDRLAAILILEDWLRGGATRP